MSQLKLFTGSAVSPTILSNAAVQLTFIGSAPGPFFNYFDLYPVEASSNLREWTPLDTALRTNSSGLPLRFLDLEAAGLALRFYRTPTNHLITALPKPTGPYPVGRIDRLLVDTNRPDRLPFMISIWYPVAPVAGVLPGLALESEIGGDAFYWGSGFTFIFQAARGYALPFAPVAATGLLPGHHLLTGLRRAADGEHRQDREPRQPRLRCRRHRPSRFLRVGAA